MTEIARLFANTSRAARSRSLERAVFVCLACARRRLAGRNCRPDCPSCARLQPTPPYQKSAAAAASLERAELARRALENQED